MPLYIGVMSGTSLDGVDIALVDLEHVPTWRIELLAYREFPFPRPLAQAVEALFVSGHHEIQRVSELSIELGQLYAKCINTFLADCDITDQPIAGIGLHGQTVRHAPDNPLPYTWQIGNPDVVACLTGIPVICDFRNKDMALGGQGAPLVPPFHQALLSQQTPSVQSEQNQFVLNLGGIANITHIDAHQVISGYDIGPANALLDVWYRAHHVDSPVQYDQAGAWAQTGQVNSQLLQLMLAEPFFARPAPKSTGKERFDYAWIQANLTQLQASQAVSVQSPPAQSLPHASPYIPAQDVQRTLLELTVITIKNALLAELTNSAAQSDFRQSVLWLCGGGAHNPLLHARLVEVLTPMNTRVDTLANSDAVEAMAFAWLAYCYDAKLNNNSPVVTGASRPAVCGKKILAQ